MKLAFLLLGTALVAAAAHADTANTKKNQLEFRTPPQAGASSGGSTADQPSLGNEKEAMFRQLDIDGDGFVSKAEAAGNAPATLGFDRADRNRDGKLSFAEYDSIGKPRPAKNSAQSKQAKTQGSASAGATKAKQK
jgi:hypothetical protein